MRNDLYRSPQKISLPFLLYHRAYYLSGGDARSRGKVGIDEPLIMPQVEVGFHAILRNEHFSMLVRRHGPGVDIQIRVKFLDGYGNVPTFENPTQGSSHNPLTHRTHHATSNEDELRHPYKKNKNT